MNKILVLYDTTTGNTAAMAELIADGARGVEGTEVRLLHIDQATPADVLWCDGIAVGTPTHMGVLSWKMKRFWDETMLDSWQKLDGKVGCAFANSYGWGGGTEMACLSTLLVLVNFGFLVFGVTHYAAERHTSHYGAVVAGPPDRAEEKAVCRLLGQRLAEWAGRRAGAPEALAS
ncbi:MAG TPA: flavodoxin family protein [Fimbriimonas sp.]